MGNQEPNDLDGSISQSIEQIRWEESGASIKLFKICLEINGVSASFCLGMRARNMSSQALRFI